MTYETIILIFLILVSANSPHNPRGQPCFAKTKLAIPRRVDAIDYVVRTYPCLDLINISLFGSGIDLIY